MRPTFFRQNQSFFRQINVFSIKVTKAINKESSWFHELFWAWSRFILLFMWKMKNISSNQLFSKHVTYTKFLPKICGTELQHFLQHSVEITEFYCHRFFTNFPSNQRLTSARKDIYCKSIWRKKIAWQWISRFSTLLCTTQCGKTRNSLKKYFVKSTLQ